ncbi:MAG: hypothetical protein AAGF11_46725 [Myxococcota bacterium]
MDDNEAIHDDFRTMLQPPESEDALDDLISEVLGDEPEQPPPIDFPDYEFDSAFQGRAAVQVVQDALTAGQSFALAFIDLRMPPGWNGVETIRHLWELDPNIQMIICSAYSDYTWEDIVEQLGPSDKLLFLRKPVDPSAVKQMALATTSRWHQDLLVRDRVELLEQRLARCERELAALTGDPPADPAASTARDAVPSVEQRRQTLQQLRQALQQLSVTALSVEQERTLDRARQMSALLGLAIAPPAEP